MVQFCSRGNVLFLKTCPPENGIHEPKNEKLASKKETLAPKNENLHQRPFPEHLQWKFGQECFHSLVRVFHSLWYKLPLFRASFLFLICILKNCLYNFLFFALEVLTIMLSFFGESFLSSVQVFKRPSKNIQLSQQVFGCVTL